MHVCEWHYCCAASEDLMCAFTLSRVRDLADLESFRVLRRVDIILFDQLFSFLGFGICPSGCFAKLIGEQNYCNPQSLY